MTIKEFAKQEKITPSRVYQLIKANRVQFVLASDHYYLYGTHTRARRGRKPDRVVQNHSQNEIANPNH